MPWIPIDISKGWQADFAPYNIPQGGLLEAINLMPYDEGLVPARDKTLYSSNGMTGSPTWAVGKEYKLVIGTKYLFLGTAEKIWRMGSTKELVDVSKVGGYSALDWSFEQYGDAVVATNVVDNPQVLNPMSADNFADLGGNPPKAKYCLLHNGHLILAHLSGYPKKIAWSGHEEIDYWGFNPIKGSDSQDIVDADGDIVGMARAGKTVCVFHENSITTVHYIGAPYTFQVIANRAENIRVLPSTIISVGAAAYFWSKQDIHCFDENAGETSIGWGIRNTILGLVDFDYAENISVEHDPLRSIIYWAIPTLGSGGLLTKIICYNYKMKRFTSINLSCKGLLRVSMVGIDADSLTYPQYPYADDMPYYADSSMWLAGAQYLGCIDDVTDKVAMLNGAALENTLETGEFKQEDFISFISQVSPDIKNAEDDVYVSVGYRMSTKEIVKYTTPNKVKVDDKADVLCSGRFLRVKIVSGLHYGITNIKVLGAAVGQA